MTATQLQMNIISAENRIFSGQVTSVNLPGTAGGFSVLPDHAPLVSSLKAGAITYETEGGTESVAIKGGFVEVNHNLITICIEQ